MEEFHPSSSREHAHSTIDARPKELVSLICAKQGAAGDQIHAVIVRSPAGVEKAVKKRMKKESTVSDS
jgi:hypothetical protein